MYHIFIEGENVLFRNDSDYIFFNNRFATSSYALITNPLAETTMSTHFHSLIEVADGTVADELIHRLRKTYNLHYTLNYGRPSGGPDVAGNVIGKIHKVEISDRESALHEILYILKNPVHHYVTSCPLGYSYSSAQYVFADSMVSPLIRKELQKSITVFRDLQYRQKYRTAGSDQVPDDWEVLDNGMILPSSYINMKRVRAFWNNNVKSFIYDINRNQTDAKNEIIDTDILDLRSSCLTDIEVCNIIDGFAARNGKKSFHYLNDNERQNIILTLRMKHVPEEQIRRCLWL